MKYLNKDFKVPNWVSCHTYFFGKENSRTYISNEKKHTYVLLDGLASDMWKLIESDSENIEQWAKSKGVYEQVEGFLYDLSEQGLVLFNDGTNKAKEYEYESINEKDESNAETSFIEEMQNWLFDNGFMFSLFFELTYRCNLKCVHCYNPKNTPNVELDYELCKKAIDDAYDAGCFKVAFSGGESTLHTKFYEIVQYARKKRMSVEIFTNGQLIANNESLYNKILKLYPYRICVSLYSTDKEMHEKVTDVKGSFDKTFDLIKKLRNDNVNVQIKNFLLNFNCMDCIKVKDFAKKIKATSLADISLIPTIEGDKKTIQYALNEDELFNLYINPESPLFLHEDFKPKNYEKIKDCSPCFGGFSGVCVNPNGNVVICVSLPYSVGNINYESIKDIWQNAVNKNPESKLYQWQKVTISDLKDCYKNDYCSFCNYCPGMGYLENGYLKKSDVLCLQAKTKMRAYNYLKNKKKNGC
ncbi:MAG: radical SAM protein [Clostridia bacterium]|nr:radical SAM protein [Clostridia bacterium]